MNIYYVYIYKNPFNNVPFYVGYGQSERMYDHLNEAKNPKVDKGNKHKLNTIRKILKQGSEPLIDIIDKDLSIEQACELETFLISIIGRADLGLGPLTNLRDGGNGGNLSPETKMLLSKMKKGKSTGPRSVESIEKQKETASKLKWYNNGIINIRTADAPSDPSFVLGRLYVTSEETKLKLSQKLSGIKREYKPRNKYSEEHCKNISINTKGKKKNNTITKNCAHCGIVCSSQNFAKYHGDRCKLNPAISFG